MICKYSYIRTHACGIITAKQKNKHCADFRLTTAVSMCSMKFLAKKTASNWEAQSKILPSCKLTASGQSLKDFTDKQATWLDTHSCRDVILWVGCLQESSGHSSLNENQSSDITWTLNQSFSPDKVCRPLYWRTSSMVCVFWFNLEGLHFLTELRMQIPNGCHPTNHPDKTHGPVRPNQSLLFPAMDGASETKP